MKRFQFRMEKVLRLRRQETDQAKRALGLALAREEAAKQAVLRAQEVLHRRMATIAQQEQEGMTTFAFGSLRAHLRLLQQYVEESIAALEAAQVETSRRRNELLQARQKEKVLERLRERRLATYTEEMLREEQKEMDEFGGRQGLNRMRLHSEV